MRVLYDHQIFQEQAFGGISRYFSELYASRSGFEAEIAVKYSNNEHLLSHPEMRNRVRPYRTNIDDCLPRLKFRGKHRLLRLIERITKRPSPDETNLKHAISSITEAQYDIFHPTYYDPYFVEVIGDRPFVLTVYDMIHELFPETITLEDSTSSRKRTLCKKATRIIAISDTTRKDLIEHFRIDPEKIDVVYLASSFDGKNDAETAVEGLPERYILFTGNRSGYKNFFFFAQAIAEILVEQSSLKLLCTGSSFIPEEHSFFDKLGIADRVAHRPAADAELATLYSRAEMFVFPSLYEGFGMPALEAFSCGCPTVLSDTPALREIAGDAALFFHPKSASELRAAVRNVLDDQVLRRTLVDRGNLRATSFSWEKTALQTSAVYHRALDSDAPH